MVSGLDYWQRPIHASSLWSHVMTTAKAQSEGPLAFKLPCLQISLEWKSRRGRVFRSVYVSIILTGLFHCDDIDMTMVPW